MAEPAPDVLAMHALARGSKLAVVDDRPGEATREVTFAELNTIVNQLANALLDAGLTPDDRLAWCGQNALEVITTLHATRKAGIGSVPINYRLTADEAAYVIDDSDAVAIVVDAERAPLLEQIADRLPKVRLVVVFAGPERPSERDRGPEREVRAAGNRNQIAYDDFVRGASRDEPRHGAANNEQVIYTSGTTGRPKGAVRRGSGDARGPALPLRSTGVLHACTRARQHRRRAASLRCRRLAATCRSLSRQHDLRRAGADSHGVQPGRQCEASL